ncbi:putative short-chain dehydrogenase/reductase NDAI_0C03930 [Naumovozyma dairenensis CBS 421]|uniref:Oxidoreductase n=1 Tax=Naumovozyma dairenensis (strain ATCC 10597 / BCRC 20456 / CBS 421 / NBRC 0211 / NRRL Y-12639) TaxID=1071378 RepID=G0W8E2_NAUDC|nr:hypothetical protein NDAI_0C03930 [Naumovozyma dairenensis CBS 421]CCD24053.1 hypothetical protein NDAI_0C03930 [Naumovozyma dairenensis CBS 421]
MFFGTKKDNSVKWEHKDISQLDLCKVNAVVFGGTSGIGRAISHQLADRGANVLVVGRHFKDEDMKKIKFLHADLSLITEADRIANEIPAKDITHMIFTTGIVAAPQREQTPEGIERDMAVSYLSRYMLIRELAGKMGKGLPHNASKPRIFIMGFPGSGQLGDPENLNSDKKKYNALSTHSNTVAANEALVLDSKDRYKNVEVFGLNPGIIKTEIRNNYLGKDSIFSKAVEWVVGWTCQTPEDYAKNICPLLVSPDLDNKSGTMFDNKGNAILQSAGLAPEVVHNFIHNSAVLVTKVLAMKPNETTSKLPV